MFSGPTLTVPSDRQAENRFFTIGFLSGRMVVVVWTPRDGGRRIISMRKAHESEQKLYGPRLGRP
ncbi:MAG TPA: BrnT family toxin [Roseiarcus sp.]|nr:BrnT family toxin [Roseiarcus sp.]